MLLDPRRKHDNKASCRERTVCSIAHLRSSERNACFHHEGVPLQHLRLLAERCHVLGLHFLNDAQPDQPATQLAKNKSARGLSSRAHVFIKCAYPDRTQTELRQNSDTTQREDNLVVHVSLHICHYLVMHQVLSIPAWHTAHILHTYLFCKKLAKITCKFSRLDPC